MDSNHGNRYITLIAMVLRALRINHAKVNSTDQEKGENGDRNGGGNNKSGPTGATRGRERRKGRQVRAG